jgi:ubiquinone/menaquinone biosynthesis C-methylase UbiE
MFKVERKTFNFYCSKRELRSCDHPVVKDFAKAKVEWIRKNIDLEQKKVLEVGAGNGYISNYLRKFCDLTVSDISEKQLGLNPAQEKVVSSVYNLPFEDNEFCCVISSNLLHHLENPQRAIDEMARVSKRFIALSEPNNQSPAIWLQSLIQRHERNSIYYSKKFLTKLVSKSNLRVINHTYSGGLVMPNFTPKFLLPLPLVKSKTRHPLSLFQIIIAKK